MADSLHDDLESTYEYPALLFEGCDLDGALL
jgi:hypothetical protein